MCLLFAVCGDSQSMSIYEFRRKLILIWNLKSVFIEDTAFESLVNWWAHCTVVALSTTNDEEQTAGLRRSTTGEDDCLYCYLLDKYNTSASTIRYRVENDDTPSTQSIRTHTLTHIRINFLSLILHLFMPRSVYLYTVAVIVVVAADSRF